MSDLPGETASHPQGIVFIARVVVRQGRWAAQSDDPPLEPNVAAGSGRREDSATWVRYAGPLRGGATGEGWAARSAPTWRDRFALALRAALDRQFGTGALPGAGGTGRQVMDERRPRLRDLGITIGTGATGPLNAITDVPGVRVGHATVIHREGTLRVGVGPARTGVTAIHPHEGSSFTAPVPAAIAVLNGAGEITGRSQVDEWAFLESPILITNTLSVGTVHRACIDWLVAREATLGQQDFAIPVVAETYDGFLNDIAGQHVTAAHTIAALDGATGGPVAEGNVGGGTGMALFGFKGGIGTSSRIVEFAGRGYTVGVLVQGNFGRRPHLLIDGVPVGRAITDLMPEGTTAAPPPSDGKDGSIIVAIATDLPLSAHQLGRLCRRGMLGIGRVGGIAGHTSGDLLIAFSNAPEVRVPRRPAIDATGQPAPFLTTPRLHDTLIDPVFEAAIDATTEAILNALVAAETLTGRDGHTLHALPHDRLRAIMREHGRLGDGG